jgi:hypothetical protein
MKETPTKTDDTTLQEQKHEITPFQNIRLRYLKAKRYNKRETKHV